MAAHELHDLRVVLVQPVWMSVTTRRSLTLPTILEDFLQLGDLPFHRAASLASQHLANLAAYLHDLLPGFPLNVIQQTFVEDLGEERLNGRHILADHDPAKSASSLRRLTAPAGGLPTGPGSPFESCHAY